MKAKPCPFCGGTELHDYQNSVLAYTFCKTCVAQGPTSTCQNRSTEAWNTRPREQELIQALEELSKQVTMRILSSAYGPEKWDALMNANHEADKLLQRIKSE